MNTRPMMMFYPGDCGCAPAPVPCYPQPASSIICDPLYLTLVHSPAGRLVIVPLGSQCQAFLEPPIVSGATIKGFAFFGADGQIYCENEPKLALPLINPKVGTSYPVPPGVQFLLVGSGEQNTAWQMVAAPTSGNYFWESVNGQWMCKATGDLPGLDTIFSNSTASNEIEVVGYKQVGQNPDGSPIFETRKLIGPTASTLPLVLKYDPLTGRYVVTTRAIVVVAPGGDPGEVFGADTVGGKQWVEIDDLGNAVTNGFPALLIADWASVDLMLYNRVTKQIRRALPFTHAYSPAETSVAAGVDLRTMDGSTDWHKLPGGHAKVSAVVVNYPMVAVHIDMEFNDNVNFDGGRLTIDDVNKRELFTAVIGDGVASARHFSYHCLLEDIPAGTHDFAFEFQKQDTFGGARYVIRSRMLVHTLL